MQDNAAMSARVLVVDDEEMVREVLARYLSREGYEVESAGNGVRALELAAARPPDLVLLDLMLPGLDGRGAGRQRQGAAGPAVIIITARDEEADRVVGLELGADDYVVKPF